MAPKFVKVTLSVVLVGVLLFGGLKFKQHLDFQSTGVEIQQLLTQARAKGFATDGKSFVKKLPDDQNAWIEIGPILLKKKDAKSSRMVYSIEHTAELLSNSEATDLPLIESALDLNRIDRESIYAVLKRKGHLQVPHDYNEGPMLLFPEVSRYRVLVSDICLDAASHGLRKDRAGTLKSLDHAFLIGSEMMKNKDDWSRITANLILSIIVRTELRIIEVDPSMLGPIKQQFEGWAPKYDPDPFDGIEWEFLKSLSVCRNFDNPLMDRPNPGFPLDQIIRTPTAKDAQKVYVVAPGSNIPNSTAMRKYMATLLNQWMPAIERMKNPSTEHTYQSEVSILEMVHLEQNCPGPLKDILATIDIGSAAVAEQFIVKTRIDLMKEMLRQLEFKQAHGKFSNHLLGPIRVQNATDIFSVNNRKTGIQIGGGDILEDGLHKYHLCYPLSVEFTSQATVNRIMKDLRNGTIGADGVKNYGNKKP